MKNYFTVILHDVNGSRQFRFHKRVKYAAAMITAATVTAAVTAFITLSELREEVASLKSAKVALQAEKAELERQSRQLQNGIDEAKTQMDAIEIAMGLKEAENTPLPFRVQRARTDAEARARVLELIPNGSPVPYKGISSKFGYRTHPITHQREMHKGTDLKAAMDTPIYATADGVVEFAGSRNTKGYGRLIILDHAYGFRTYYGHLHKIEVTNGQVLKKGDLIGYSGNSGTSRASTRSPSMASSLLSDGCAGSTTSTNSPLTRSGLPSSQARASPIAQA